MKKQFRKITAVLLAVVMMVLMMPIAITTVVAANTEDELVAIALGEVGSTNYYKYYGGNYNAWCADFVTWCAQQAGVTSISNSSSCTAMYNGMKNNGCREVSAPQKGDLVFYYNSNRGSWMHVGIMIDSSTAISGNYWLNNYSQVARHNYNSYWDETGARCTAVFVRPNYQNDTPVDLGTDFYAFIMNKAKWKPLTVERDENVVIRGEKADHCADQMWKFERQGDGSYKIVSLANGKCLDVHNASNSAGTNVKVWEDNGNDAQRWYIYGNTYSKSFVLKAKCTDCVLDVYGNHSDDGTNVQMYTRHDGESEIFEFYVLYNRTFAVNLGNDFTATFLNKKSWIPLINDEKGNVSLQKETGISRNLWRFKRQTDGSYIISSCYDGKCFDLQDWSHNDGTNVQAYSENGYDAQRWYFYEYGGGYTVQSKESGKLLDVKDGNLSFGANIQTWAWNGTDSQVFSIYKGDECKIKAVDLSATVKSSNVTFNWNNVYGETGFNLRIWSGKHWEGDSYKDVWNLPENTTSTSVELPPGKYEAYVDTYNHYDLLMSNVVSFEVLPQLILSVYPKEHILKCNWEEVLKAESYKIEIFDSGANLVSNQDNIKELQYQMPISEGNYTVKLTSNNNLSITKPLIVNFIEGKIGDVNLDGYINVDDGNFFLKTLTRDEEFPNRLVADTNMDGETSVIDVRLILRYISGKEVQNIGNTVLLNSIGDTNLDGVIDISDVTAIQYHLVELRLFTDEQLALADTNGDGLIDINDATYLQIYLAGYDVVLGKQ